MSSSSRAAASRAFKYPVDAMSNDTAVADGADAEEDGAERLEETVRRQFGAPATLMKALPVVVHRIARRQERWRARDEKNAKERAIITMTVGRSCCSFGYP